MRTPDCDECRAIYRELLGLMEQSRRNGPGQGATPQELMRKLKEHLTATGHVIIPPIPPGAWSIRIDGYDVAHALLRAASRLIGTLFGPMRNAGILERFRNASR
jgi:hypothetical protein